MELYDQLLSHFIELSNEWIIQKHVWHINLGGLVLDKDQMCSYLAMFESKWCYIRCYNQKSLKKVISKHFLTSVNYAKIIMKLSMPIFRIIFLKI